MEARKRMAALEALDNETLNPDRMAELEALDNETSPDADIEKKKSFAFTPSSDPFNLKSITGQEDILSPSKFGLSKVLTDKGVMDQIKLKHGFTEDDEVLAYVKDAGKAKKAVKEHARDFKDLGIEDSDAFMQKPIEELSEWYHKKAAEIAEIPEAVQIGGPLGTPLNSLADARKVKDAQMAALDNVRDNVIALKLGEGQDDPIKRGLAFKKLFQPGEYVHYEAKAKGKNLEQMTIPELLKTFTQAEVADIKRKGVEISLAAATDKAMPVIEAYSPKQIKFEAEYKRQEAELNQTGITPERRQQIFKENANLVAAFANDPDVIAFAGLTTEVRTALGNFYRSDDEFPLVVALQKKKQDMDRAHKEEPLWARQIGADVIEEYDADHKRKDTGIYGLVGSIVSGTGQMVKGVVKTLNTLGGKLGFMSEEDAFFENVRVEAKYTEDYYTPKGSQVREFSGIKLPESIQMLSEKMGIDKELLAPLGEAQHEFNPYGVVFTMGEVTTQVAANAAMGGVIAKGVQYGIKGLAVAAGAAARPLGLGSSMMAMGGEAAVNAGKVSELLRNPALMAQKTASLSRNVGQMATSLVTTYGDNYEAGLAAGLTPDQAEKYGTASSLVGMMIEQISPDLKLARQVLGKGTSKVTLRQVTNNLYDQSLSKNQRLLAFSKAYAKTAFTNISTEVVEEVADLFKTRVLDAGYGINTSNMPLAEDLQNTIVTTAIGMIPMAILGGNKESNRLRQESLWMGGSRPEVVQKYLQDEIDQETDIFKKEALQQKANQTMQIANTMNRLIGTLPEVNGRGRKLTLDEKQHMADYLFKAEKLKNDLTRSPDAMKEKLSLEKEAAETQAVQIMEGQTPAYLVNGAGYSREQFQEYLRSDGFKRNKDKFRIEVFNDEEVENELAAAVAPQEQAAPLGPSVIMPEKQTELSSSAPAVIMPGAAAPVTAEGGPSVIMPTPSPNAPSVIMPAKQTEPGATGPAVIMPAKQTEEDKKSLGRDTEAQDPSLEGSTPTPLVKPKTQGQIYEKNDQDQTDINATVNNLIGKRVVYKGQEGDLVQNGDNVELDTDNGPAVQIGKVQDVGGLSAAESGFVRGPQIVGVSHNEDGSLNVRGKNYTAPTADPLAAIAYDAEGNVSSVDLVAEGGQKRAFRGQSAEDIAYQMHLRDMDQKDQKEKFNEYIQSDEGTLEIQQAEVRSAAQEGTDQNNAAVLQATGAAAATAGTAPGGTGEVAAGTVETTGQQGQPAEGTTELMPATAGQQQEEGEDFVHTGPNADFLNKREKVAKALSKMGFLGSNRYFVAESVMRMVDQVQRHLKKPVVESWMFETPGATAARQEEDFQDATEDAELSNFGNRHTAAKKLIQDVINQKGQWSEKEYEFLYRTAYNLAAQLEPGTPKMYPEPTGQPAKGTANLTASPAKQAAKAGLSKSNPNYLFATTFRGDPAYNLFYKGKAYVIRFYEDRGEELVKNWFADVVQIDGQDAMSRLYFGSDEFDLIGSYESKAEMISHIESFARDGRLQIEASRANKEETAAAATEIVPVATQVPPVQGSTAPVVEENQAESTAAVQVTPGTILDPNQRATVQQELDAMLAMVEGDTLQKQTTSTEEDTIGLTWEDVERFKASSRGVDASITALRQAAADGRIAHANADLAIALLQHRPDLFRDLALSIATSKNPDTQGWYMSALNWITLFDNQDPLVGAHELLHHSERYLPQDVRQAIKSEWQKQVHAQIKTFNERLQKEALTDEERYNMLLVVRYLQNGLQRATERDPVQQQVLKVLQKMALNTLGTGTNNEIYSLLDPSEWWATHGSRMMAEKMEKMQTKGWIAKAKQWYQEFLQAVKSIGKTTRLIDNPAAFRAIEKGLEAILSGRASVQGDTNKLLSQGPLQSSMAAPGSTGDSQKATLAEGVVSRLISLDIVSYPEMLKYLADHRSTKLLPFMADAYRKLRDNYVGPDSMRDRFSTDAQIQSIASTPPPPPSGGQQTAATLGPGQTRLTHAATEEKRAALGLDPRVAHLVTTDPVLQAQAQAEIQSGYNIDMLIDDILSTTRPNISALETAILLEYQAALEAQLDGAVAQVEQAVRDGDRKGIKDGRFRMDDLMNQIRDAYLASEKAGSAAGLALHARKLYKLRNDTLAAYFLRHMEAAAVEELPQEYQDTIAKFRQEVMDLQAKYDQSIIELEAIQAKEQADKVFQQQKLKTQPRGEKKNVKKTSEDFTKERNTILENLREKLRKSKGKMYSSIIPFHPLAAKLVIIAPDVARLTRSFVEQGYSKLEDVVTEIHAFLVEEIPEISPEDVRDVIAGEYNNNLYTKDEITQRIDDMRHEAQLLNKLEALVNGEVPPSIPKQMERNREITKLRQEIKDFKRLKSEAERKARQAEKEAQKKSPEEIAQEAAKKRFRDQIEEMQSDLETGDWINEKPRNEIVLDQEGEDLRQTRDALSQQIADLREQERLVGVMEGLLRGDPAETPKQKIQRNQEITRLRQEIKDFKKAKADAEKQAHKQANKDQIALEAVKKSLTKQIDKLQEILNKGGLANLKAAAPQVTLDPEAQALQQTRDLLSQEIADRREEARLAGRLNALLNNTPAAPRLPPKQRSAEIVRLKKEISDLKKSRTAAASAIKAALRLAQKKTPDQIAIAALRTRLQNQIKKLEDDLRTGNWANPKPVKPRNLALDPATLALREKLYKLKHEEDVRLYQLELSRRKTWEKWVDGLKSLANVSNSLTTTIDISIMFRQGGVASISHPFLARRAAIEMGKAIASKEAHDQFWNDVHDSWDYEMLKESELGLTDPIDPRLVMREEDWMNNLAEKIPLVGQTLRVSNKVKIPGADLIGRSQRAAVIYLNKLRIDLFRQFYDTWAVKFPYEQNKNMYKQYAKLINNTTGRGGLNFKTLENATGLLNILIWSVRLNASRFSLLTNMINPRFYWITPAPVIREYFKDMAKYAAFNTSVLAMIKYATPCDVELDPRSSDFGKLACGEWLRYDIWGGFLQIIRVAAQVLTGETKDLETGEIKKLGVGYKANTRGTQVMNFLRGKLNPTFATMPNLLTGTDMIGNEVTIGSEARRLTLPMIVNSTAEGLLEGRPSVFYTETPWNFIGIGVQRMKEKSFGDKIDRKMKAKFEKFD